MGRRDLWSRGDRGRWNGGHGTRRVGPHNPLGCQVEGPGKDHCDGEPENGENDDERQGPIGQRQRRKHDFADLHEKPGDDHVDDGNAYYVASLQLLEESGSPRHPQTTRLVAHMGTSGQPTVSVDTVFSGSFNFRQVPVSACERAFGTGCYETRFNGASAYYSFALAVPTP